MKALRQILAFLLVPVLLWSGAGFSVSRHYCMGMLKSESFYQPAHSCTMKAEPAMASADCDGNSCSAPELPATPSNPEDYQWMLELDCCQNEWLSIPGISIEKTTQHEQNITAPALVGLAQNFSRTEFSPFATSADFPLYSDSSPPLPTAVRLALHQQFLI